MDGMDLLGSFILLAYAVLVEHFHFFLLVQWIDVQLHGKLQTASWFDGEGSPIFRHILSSAARTVPATKRNRSEIARAGG